MLALILSHRNGPDLDPNSESFLVSLTNRPSTLPGTGRKREGEKQKILSSYRHLYFSPLTLLTGRWVEMNTASQCSLIMGKLTEQEYSVK